MYVYEVVTIFGANIVASEGEQWKKYRKIAAPAFSEVRPERRLRSSSPNAGSIDRKIIN